MLTSMLLLALTSAPAQPAASHAVRGVYFLPAGTALVLDEQRFRLIPPPPDNPLLPWAPETRGALAVTADALQFTPERGEPFRVTYAVDHGVLLLGALVKRGGGYLAELPPPRLLGGAVERVVRWSPAEKRLQVDGVSARGVECVRRPSAPEVWVPVVPARDPSPFATGADWRGEGFGFRVGRLAVRAIQGQALDRERVFSSGAPGYRDLDGGTAIAGPFTVALGEVGLWPGDMLPLESAGRYRCGDEGLTLITPLTQRRVAPPLGPHGWGCVPHRPLAGPVELQPDADHLTRQVVRCDCQQNHRDPVHVVTVLPLDAATVAVHVADTLELATAQPLRCQRLPASEGQRPSRADAAQ